MSVTLFVFLLFAASYATMSIESSDLSAPNSNEGISRHGSLVNEIHRNIEKLELTQRSEQEEILKLRKDNDGLKKIVEAIGVERDTIEREKAINEDISYFNIRRSFTTAPKLTPRKVAFTVKLPGSENHNIRNGATIKFTDIVTNEGGHYSSISGEFTAPEDGTYVFMASIFTCVNGYFEANIEKNGAPMVPIHAGDHTGHEMATAAVTMILTKGDIVRVAHNLGEGECLYGNTSNFSGFKI